MSNFRPDDFFYCSVTRVVRVARERFFGLGQVAALPTAEEKYRGTLARTEGGAGVADTASLCFKNAADAYAWSNLVTAATQRPTLILIWSSGPDVAGDREWTNMPSAETELFGVPRNRAWLDLANATQFRVHAYVNVVGAATSRLRAQYSIDGSTWTAMGAAANDGSVLIDATGYQLGTYANIVTAAKAGVYLRITGVNGNGAADPNFGNIYLEVK